MVQAVAAKSSVSTKKDIFDTIVSGRATSRKDLAKALSLRPNTVSDLVNEMVEADLVWEQTMSSTGRGRPMVALVPNHNRLVAILFQMDSRCLIASVVNLQGTVVYACEQVVDEAADNAAMAKTIQHLYNEAKQHLPPRAELAGLIFSLAGIMEAENLTWVFCSRWPNMRNLNIAEAIQEDLEMVLVRNMDQELKARLRQSQSSSGGTLLLHWGYGIGTAYAHQGAPVNEHEGRFGEIGHWQLKRAEGLECVCGAKGCLETVAALWALMPSLQKKFPQISNNEKKLADELRTLDLLSMPEMSDALEAVIMVTANLCRAVFPKRVYVSSPLIENPFFWAKFNELFRSTTIIPGIETPELISATRSYDLERLGAIETILPKRLMALMGG
ncbi:ROK family transcriptional regulator [Rhodobacteraceae bacterium RKSG542]|uniref:ROK family transcriptional regulator n=1 Tax=Pseudovibrio flavus TaxID=2529854 RepID=UPI0012BBE8F3|nr:ROK family transcriptional regulator [Pseudovibrio flavus]MTI18108.1 ROK family transcriptional regulator [Pseudovibrio flavus]